MRIDHRLVCGCFAVLMVLCAAAGWAQDKETGPWGQEGSLGILEMEDFRSAASQFLAGRFGGTDTSDWLTFEPAQIRYSGHRMEMRLDIRIHGIRVHAGHVTLIVDAQSHEVESITSALRFVDAIPRVPAFDSEQALASAMSLGDYPGWTTDGKPEQIYVILDDGRPHLAWRQPVTWLEGQTTLRGHAVVDAISADLIWMEKAPELISAELFAKGFEPDPPRNLRVEYCNNALITSWNTSGAQFYRVRVGSNSNFNNSTIVDSWTDPAPSVPGAVCLATQQSGSTLYVWVEACNQVGNLFCSKAGPLRRTNMFTCR